METKSRSEKTTKNYTPKSPSVAQNQDNKLIMNSGTSKAEPPSEAEQIHTAIREALSGSDHSKSQWALPPSSKKGDCNQIKID
jgi:hypothetical protein